MAGKQIESDLFGVSFSIKQCHNFQLSPQETLDWLINEAGFRRFRLMSYWNEHEKEPGKYDFKELDWQVEKIADAGGIISLCLGAKQPRWPESHWPKWALELTKPERDKALLKYIETVVKRYKTERAIISYQLENEALLERWGENAEVDRRRLKQEFKLVKQLDPSRPVVMTTSTSWGIPLRGPIPDIVGFSYYHVIYRDGAYHKSLFYPWIHRLRKSLIKLIWRRPVFIHELQLEPWGHTAIWKMTPEDQAKSMNPDQIKQNVEAGKSIKAPPIDLWGGEWWYWRLQQGDDYIWQAVRKAITWAQAH